LPAACSEKADYLQEKLALQDLARMADRPLRAQVWLGAHATNGLALVLHELATNAAKYGAFKSEVGSFTSRGRLRMDV
jgi:two-component sensor histidine kinase